MSKEKKQIVGTAMSLRRLVKERNGHDGGMNSFALEEKGTDGCMIAEE
jgi:hypothetical protein